MKQSTSRSCRVTARFALALLLGGAVVTAPASADDTIDGEGEDGGAATRSAPAQPGAGDAAPAPAAALRPRWVEPRRGTGESVSPEATRDWRGEGRVIIHAERDQARLATAVEGVLGELLGAQDVGRRIVDATVSTDQVRFFHAEDAAMAADLAAVLELLFGEVRVRDLTSYRPQPDRGTLEVWLR